MGDISEPGITMKILVTRTSRDWNLYDAEESRPCNEVVRCTYIDVDERTVDHPDKLYPKNRFTSDWYDDPRFTNHRVENGHIKRDKTEEGWCICLDTLDELKLFVTKYGKCVISVEDGNPDTMKVEIYDTWRE